MGDLNVRKTEFDSFDAETLAKLFELGQQHKPKKAEIKKRKTEIYDKYDRPFEVNPYGQWRNNISFFNTWLTQIDVLTLLDTGSELEKCTISPIYSNHITSLYVTYDCNKAARSVLTLRWNCSMTIALSQTEKP